MSAPTPVLRLGGVSIDAGSTRVVSHLELAVAPGEIVALVAPSGTGKTTTLRAIVRLGDLADGEILLGGEPIGALPATTLRRRCALVAQHPAMLGPTVADDLMQGAARPLTTGEARALLAEVGLPAAMAERVSGELSGGEQARVAVARALAGEPEVLLLDEPSAALDHEAMLHLAGALRDRAAAGLAILIVSHDPALLEATGARVARLGPQDEDGG